MQLRPWQPIDTPELLHQPHHSLPDQLSAPFRGHQLEDISVTVAERLPPARPISMAMLKYHWFEPTKLDEQVTDRSHRSKKWRWKDDRKMHKKKHKFLPDTFEPSSIRDFYGDKTFQVRKKEWKKEKIRDKKNCLISSYKWLCLSLLCFVVLSVLFNIVFKFYHC